MKRQYLIFRSADAEVSTSGSAPDQMGGAQDFGNAPAGSKPPTLIGQVTAGELNAWKVRYPLGVFAVVKDGRIAYFQHPGFNEINCYYALSKSEQQVTDEWRSITGMLFIGGDRELIENVKYLGRTARRCIDKVVGEQNELVNL